MFNNPQQEEGYNFVDFSENYSVVSPQFKRLDLSVKELLSPPVVEQLIKDEQAKLKTLEQEAETERQRAEIQQQRAEKLASRLLEMGVNPEELD